MSSMQCIEGYKVTLKVFDYYIHLDRNGQLRKKLRRHFNEMNIDRNIKVPDLILSTILLLKTDIG